MRVKAWRSWAKWPAALLLVALWIPLLPLAWVLVKVGDAGHFLGDFLGIETRASDNWLW